MHVHVCVHECAGTYVSVHACEYACLWKPAESFEYFSPRIIHLGVF